MEPSVGLICSFYGIRNVTCALPEPLAPGPRVRDGVELPSSGAPCGAISGHRTLLFHGHCRAGVPALGETKSFPHGSHPGSWIPLLTVHVGGVTTWGVICAQTPLGLRGCYKQCHQDGR